MKTTLFPLAKEVGGMQTNLDFFISIIIQNGSISVIMNGNSEFKR